MSNEAADHLRSGHSRLPQWQGEGEVYFVTWRLDAKGDSLSAAERSLVVDALIHFNEDRYRLAAYVVMDDHVHVLVLPLPPYDLSRVLHSWKSFSALVINRRRGVSGTCWQKDSYTRMIRDEAELHSTLKYIIGNPKARWPEINDYQWAAWFDVF